MFEFIPICYKVHYSILGRELLADEAEVSGDDTDEDMDSDGDISDLIDDEDDVENDTTFYNVIDQDRIGK